MASSLETQLPIPETLPSDEPPPSDPPSSAGDKRKRDSDDLAPEPENPLPPSPANHPLWKTSLCSFFRRQPAGTCGHGETCRYAHSEAELRLRPDKTWDPTSERAKKLAKKSEEEEEADEEDDDGGEVMMTEDVVDDGDEDDGDASESRFRKCLVHLPKTWKSENLVAFLNDQGVSHKSAKKKKGMTVGFVGFETAEQSQKGTEELQGKIIGSKSIKVADVLPRSFEKKANAEKNGKPEDGTQDGDSNNENSTANGSSSGSGKTARDVVTPLAHMSYADQLEHKRSSISHLLKKLTRNARKACPNGVSQPGWIANSRDRGGLPCNLEGILASPLVNGYRNKCEFSVGYSLQGKITVGFMLGNFREGVTAVEEPIDCPNVSTIGCGYASIFQEFLQQSSLPIWNRFKNSGFWRQLTVREGRRSEKADDSENHEAAVAEVLLMIQVCTTGCNEAVVNGEFEKMAEAFSSGAAKSSPSLPLTHVVVQDHRGISNVSPADAPLRPLQIHSAECSPETEGNKNLDEPRIHDYISNLKFCISPTAFFQVNTLAAEKLYSLAGDWAGLGPDTLLFDVCCGTGTIGLTLAHRVGMVVGIEMNASAVLDAQRNAEINGIKNCRFICSKAEDVMGSLLMEYHSQTEDEVPKESENGDKVTSENGVKVTSTNGEKDIGPENVQDPERLSGQSSENIAEPAESSNPELENANPAPECPEDSLKKAVTEVQSGISESQNTSARTFKNVVAIVDPPRSGLHPTVIKALRTHPLLRRLVYISCNPESLVANAIELCTPSPDKIEKGNKGNRGWRNMSAAGLARHRSKSMPISEPFVPVKAMAVDLFPHTPHCEMVMLLER